MVLGNKTLVTIQNQTYGINLNDIIRVKLTDHGKDIYYHQFDDLNNTCDKPIIIPSYPKVDVNGFTEMQLWNFIRIYGQYIYPGSKLVIENNRIYISGMVLDVL